MRGGLYLDTCAEEFAGSGPWRAAGGAQELDLQGMTVQQDTRLEGFKPKVQEPREGQSRRPGVDGGPSGPEAGQQELC